MTRRDRCLAMLIMLAMLAISGSPAVFAAQPTSQPSRPAPPLGAQESFFKGTVVDILAPTLFSIRENEDTGRELLVLTSREVSTSRGATVAVSGTLRQFGKGAAAQARGWAELDEQLRARLAGRRVVVATAVLSSAEPQLGEAEQPAEAETAQGPEPPQASVASAAPVPVSLPTSTVENYIEYFAGQQVRIESARVVDVIAPGVLLVEPATKYLKPLAERGRLAVVIAGSALRVAAGDLIGSVVELEGVARSLLSLNVTHQEGWPAGFDRDTIRRLDVRAAIVATSLQTAEGTELTDRRTPGR